MQKNDESEHEINSQQSCFQLYCRTEKSWFLHGEVTSQYCITSQKQGEGCEGDQKQVQIRNNHKRNA